jgi:uncharacterized damage-inducible protein DinB
MLDHERTAYAWVLDYTRKLADGIPEADMAVQPAPGMNTPLWILGHLAVVADYAAKLLGEPREGPRAWHVAFGPGSRPEAPPDPAPTKAALLAALEAQHARVSAAAARLAPERLREPHPFDLAPLKASFPTVGELLTHMMTTHPAMHLGQLSAWRRLRGLPAVLGF